MLINRFYYSSKDKIKNPQSHQAYTKYKKLTPNTNIQPRNNNQIDKQKFATYGYNQRQQQHILNIKLPNKPKTFEQNIISDTNNNNNNNTSKNIITTENLISQNTLTKIYNNNYIQTPKYKNTSSLLVKKTLERNYLLTQLNESLFRVLKHSSSHKVYDSLSEEEIDNIETKHLYLIFPDSLFIKLWQFLLFLLSLCTIFILPIDLAFIPNINTYTLTILKSALTSFCLLIY